MFNSYATIMASQPTVFQNTTLATVSAVAGPVGAGFQLYSNVSNLSGSWTGSGQQAQGSQASGLLSKGQQILTATTQTQQIINGGAQQLQNAKTRLGALTKGATGEGFTVLPVGKVILGPAQLAKIAALHAGQHHAEAEALRAQLLARAASYNAQIDLVVLQTNMADAQVALTLANSAVSILGALTQNNSSTATPPQTSTAAPPTLTTTSGGLTPTTPIVGGTPGPNAAGTGTGFGTGTGTGTALAGAGPLGGAGGTPLGLTGAGGSSLSGGGGGLNTAGLNPSVLGGTAGLGPGMVGTRQAALASEAAAGRGATSMGPGMVSGGAGMAGSEAREERDRDGSDWLAEDGDPWGTDDAPNDVGGVLS
jgi:hypothetical protein